MGAVPGHRSTPLTTTPAICKRLVKTYAAKNTRLAIVAKSSFSTNSKRFRSAYGTLTFGYDGCFASSSIQPTGTGTLLKIYMAKSTPNANKEASILVNYLRGTKKFSKITSYYY